MFRWIPVLGLTILPLLPIVAHCGVSTASAKLLMSAIPPAAMCASSRPGVETGSQRVQYASRLEGYSDGGL